MRSQFEMVAGLMREFISFQSGSWMNERNFA